MRVLIGLCLVGIGLVCLFLGAWTAMDTFAPPGAEWSALIIGVINLAGGVLLLRKPKDKRD